MVTSKPTGGAQPRETEPGDGPRLRIVRPDEDQAAAGASARAKLPAPALTAPADNFETEPAPKTEAEWAARHGRIAAEVLDRLFRIVMRRIQDAAEANGLMVEILMEYFAWERKSAEVTGQVPTNPWPILSTIVRRRTVDWFRRMKVRRAQPLGDDDRLDLPFTEPPQDHRDVWLREAFTAFRGPPAACPHNGNICPEVLVARHFEDKTLREIGVDFSPGGHALSRSDAANRGFYLVRVAEQCFREFMEKRRSNR